MKNTAKSLWAVYLLVLIAMALGIGLGNHAVQAMAQVPERETCFIVDPGHGGVDGGATSCTGRLESAYNLEISLKLRDLLQLLGYDTRMIRETDISVYTKGETIGQKKVSDLKERLRICTETPGAILLSIHQNNFSDSRYSGAQVFYGPSQGSEAFAKAAQRELVRTLNPGSRRSEKKAAGIYLMEHIPCPGILVECGFLSNPEEEARLSSPEYQKKLCCVIAACAVSFANT